MANFVKHAEHRDVAPARTGSKPREMSKHRDGHLLDHAQCAHVEMRYGGECGIKLFIDARTLERLAHPGNTRFLLPLHSDVIAVRYPKWLFPPLPALLRNARRP